MQETNLSSSYTASGLDIPDTVGVFVGGQNEVFSCRVEDDGADPIVVPDLAIRQRRRGMMGRSVQRSIDTVPVTHPIA